MKKNDIDFNLKLLELYISKARAARMCRFHVVTVVFHIISVLVHLAMYYFSFPVRF